MNATYYTAAQLGQQVGLHRTSVKRLMARAGISGLKAGTARQASRRYSPHDYERLLAWMRKQAGQSIRSDASISKEETK